MKSSKKQLEEKAWYRALKALFVISFVFIQYFMGWIVWGKFGYVVISFLVISFIFWLIARIFFYIALGEPIIKFKKK